MNPCLICKITHTRVRSTKRLNHVCELTSINELILPQENKEKKQKQKSRN